MCVYVHARQLGNHGNVCALVRGQQIDFREGSLHKGVFDCFRTFFLIWFVFVNAFFRVCKCVVNSLVVQQMDARSLTLSI